eukprot:751472-Hanusia_phi.AAC.3
MTRRTVLATWKATLTRPAAKAARALPFQPPRLTWGRHSRITSHPPMIIGSDPTDPVRYGSHRTAQAPSRCADPGPLSGSPGCRGTRQTASLREVPRAAADSAGSPYYGPTVESRAGPGRSSNWVGAGMRGSGVCVCNLKASPTMGGDRGR